MAATLDALDPGLADAARSLDSAVHQSGLQGRFSSTLRTSAEQKRLYDRFVAGQSQFPAVPPGFSTHEYGLAFDYVVSPYEYQTDVGELWKSWGGAWYGSDVVHFELPGATAAVKEYAESQLAPSGEPERGSRIAAFINDWFLTVGPWWTGLSGASVLKKAVSIEKSLGFDAAINWFYRHVAVNPDAPPK